MNIDSDILQYLGFFALFLAIIIFLTIIISWKQLSIMESRKGFIKKYKFPEKIGEEIKKEYPHLTDNDIYVVISALKEFFLAFNESNYKKIGMPSKVVDLAWHHFILFTKDYEAFCQNAFGRFFHHVPSIKKENEKAGSSMLINTWMASCSLAGESSTTINRLPLLFSIDETLKIENGYHYDLKEMKKTLSSKYSGSSVGCGGGCGGA